MAVDDFLGCSFSLYFRKGSQTKTTLVKVWLCNERLKKLGKLLRISIVVLEHEGAFSAEIEHVWHCLIFEELCAEK